MNKILRVQDKDGRGPWKPGFSHVWVEWREEKDNLVPWYVEFGRVDEEVLYGEYCGSGCRNIEQIRKWFTPKEYETLLTYKYQLVEMEVNRIIAESDIQLFFGRAKPLNEDFKIIVLY